MWGTLVTDAAGNAYVAGMTDDESMAGMMPGMGGLPRLFVRKYNLAGDEQWTRLGDSSEFFQQRWLLGSLVVDDTGNTKTLLYQYDFDTHRVLKLRVHKRSTAGVLTSVVDLPDWPAMHAIYLYPTRAVAGDGQDNVWVHGAVDGTTPVSFVAKLKID